MAKKAAPVDPLLDGAILHRISLERMQTGTIKAINRLLDEASVDLERKIVRAAPSRAEQLRGLLKSIKAARVELFAAVHDRLKGDLRDLAKYEVEFKERLYGGALGAGVTFNRPTVRELEWLVTHAPISGVQLKGWVDKLSADDLFRLNQAIRVGMAQAETPREIAQRLIGYKHADGAVKGTKRNAEMLARTAYTHVQAQTEIEFLLQNRELFSEYVWISVLDERTTLVCRERAGNIYKVADYEKGEAPVPPAHINCLPGDTLVTTRDPATAVSKRWFEGRLVGIRTAAGHALWSTPNHPILTDRGWVPAQGVKLGDKVVSRDVADDEKGMVAPIAEIARLAAEAPGALTCPVPIAAQDFHGDGIDGQVGVIYADRRLLADRIAERTQLLRETVLGRAPVGQAGLPCFGALELLTEAMGPAAASGVGLGRELLALGGGRPAHAGELLFMPAAQSDAAFAEQPLDGTFTDAEHLRDAARANAGGVQFVDVVGVETREFSDHVYNLITTDGLILANGLVTHNCRSHISGIPRGYDKTGLTEDLSFEDWLQRTSDAARVAALGKKGLALWKAGKLPVKRYVDPTGAALTVDGVKAADAEQAAFLGAAPEGVLPPGVDYGGISAEKAVELRLTRPQATALPLEQRRAIETYTTGLGFEINSGLRGLTPSPNNAMVASLDAAIAATKTKEPLTVRRFLAASPGLRKQYAAAQPGDIIKEPGYSSTTLATSFGDTKRFAMRIHIPKGAHALYVAPVSDAPDELELLLPRGARFEVVRKYVDGEVRWLDVKLIVPK